MGQEVVDAGQDRQGHVTMSALAELRDERDGRQGLTMLGALAELRGMRRVGEMLGRDGRAS